MIIVISTKCSLKASTSFRVKYFVMRSMVVLTLKLLLYSTIRIITKIKFIDLDVIEVVIIATAIIIRFS